MGKGSISIKSTNPVDTKRPLRQRKQNKKSYLQNPIEAVKTTGKIKSELKPKRIHWKKRLLKTEQQPPSNPPASSTFQSISNKNSSTTAVPQLLPSENKLPIKPNTIQSFLLMSETMLTQGGKISTVSGILLRGVIQTDDNVFHEDQLISFQNIKQSDTQAIADMAKLFFSRKQQ